MKDSALPYFAPALAIAYSGSAPAAQATCAREPAAPSSGIGSDSSTPMKLSGPRPHRHVFSGNSGIGLFDLLHGTGEVLSSI